MLNAKETSLAEETPGVQNIYFGVHGLYLHMVARCLYSLPYTFSQSVLETGQWIFYLQQHLRFLPLCFYSVPWKHKNFVALKMFLNSNTPDFWSYFGCISQQKINQLVDMVICITKFAYETNKKIECIETERCRSEGHPGNCGNCPILKVTTKN